MQLGVFRARAAALRWQASASSSGRRVQGQGQLAQVLGRGVVAVQQGVRGGRGAAAAAGQAAEPGQQAQALGIAGIELQLGLAVGEGGVEVAGFEAASGALQVEVRPALVEVLEEGAQARRQQALDLLVRLQDGAELGEVEAFVDLAQLGVDRGQGLGRLQQIGVGRVGLLHQLDGLDRLVQVEAHQAQQVEGLGEVEAASRSRRSQMTMASSCRPHSRRSMASRGVAKSGLLVSGVVMLPVIVLGRA